MQITYYIDRPAGMHAHVGDDQTMRYLWNLAADGYSVPVRFEEV